VAFDATAARDVVLPLAQAAYTVMDGGKPVLPRGFTQAALIEADGAVLTAMTAPHPAAKAIRQPLTPILILCRAETSPTPDDRVLQCVVCSASSVSPSPAQA
jgi:hypothetical protein